MGNVQTTLAEISEPVNENHNSSGGDTENISCDDQVIPRDMMEQFLNEEKPPDKWKELLTPTKACSVLDMESRSPTSRFLHSKRKDSGRSIRHRLFRTPQKLDHENEIAFEVVRDDSVFEETSVSSTSLTLSAQKRQKKREKKKARAAQKEDLLKKQKAQRAEEIRSYKEHRMNHKRVLAAYAAAVAKPTIPSKEVRSKRGTERVEHRESTKKEHSVHTSPKDCPPKPPSAEFSNPLESFFTPSSSPSVAWESPATANVLPLLLDDGAIMEDPLEVPSSPTRFVVAPCGSTFHETSAPPSPAFTDWSLFSKDFLPNAQDFPKSEKTTSSGVSSASVSPSSSVSPRRLTPARNREITPPRKNRTPVPRPDTPIKKAQLVLPVVSKKKIFESETEETDGPTEKIDVLVRGGSRKVTELQPREQLPFTSTCSDRDFSQPEMVETTLNPRREIVGIPPISTTAQSPAQRNDSPNPASNPAYVYNTPLQPPPRFVPVRPIQPIYGNFGAVPIRNPPQITKMPFVPLPPHQPPFPMIPMGPPPGIPMQMMMNGQMYVQGPPPGMPMPPPGLMQPVYPTMVSVQRPVRAPIPIVTPPRTADGKQIWFPINNEIIVLKKREKVFMTENVENVAVKQEKADSPQQFRESPKTSVHEESMKQNPILTLNDDFIVAGIASLLDSSDDEHPPPPSPLVIQSTTESEMDEAQQAVIKRVFESTKEQANFEFNIWKGFSTEMPPRPEETPVNSEIVAILNEPEKDVQENDSPSDSVQSISSTSTEKNELTLVTVCKQMEPYFRNTKVYWMSRRVDGNMLRDMFNEAYNGEIPPSHMKILDKVCSFEPGYFHVFHELIGAAIEFTYSYERLPGNFEEDDEKDELYILYSSLPNADGVKNFFNRFDTTHLQQAIPYISERFIPIRVFVAILEVLYPPNSSNALTTSDLYYLATLVFGDRPFYQRFITKFNQLQIVEAAGKRWIRRCSSTETSFSRMPLFINDTDMFRHGPTKNVTDFINRLRPHIDDVLHLLPSGVVNEHEFFKAIKLVCGFHGDDEERIWEKIVKDRTKFQEFYDIYRHFVRIEIRSGTMLIQKKSYTEDEESDVPLNVIVSGSSQPLPSVLKSDAPHEDLAERKSVSYASTQINSSSDEEKKDIHVDQSTQTGNLELEMVWNVEKELIRHLKSRNITFEQFIQCDDAEELHQFLVDFFKSSDLQLLAQMLEASITKMRENSWMETLQLRRAAEEANVQLCAAREQHKREFGELKQRMETMALFETIDLQNDSKIRIGNLRGRIEEMRLEQEKMVEAGIKEEKLRMQREFKEEKQRHLLEERNLQLEIQRLTRENAHVLTDEDVGREIFEIEKKHAETLANCKAEMKKKYDDTTRVLIAEINSLRLENQRLHSSQSSPSRETISSSSGHGEFSVSSTNEFSAQSLHMLQITEKTLAEIDFDQLRSNAREILERYIATGANRKDRKNAEKQLREFEALLKFIDESLQHNLELLQRGKSDGLIDVPEVPMPFSERVLQKIYDEEQSCSPSAPQQPHQAPEIEKQGEEEEVDGCLICHDEMIDGHDETISCDTCGRMYHYECISRWLNINSVCPTCFRALKDPNEFPALG